ncbi:hypothetical protein [Gracilinema caldarium]|nr:hypothetical protein [Gracilinema caldarium]
MEENYSRLKALNILDIFLFIANRDYRSGGQWKPIAFGTAQAIQIFITALSWASSFLLDQSLSSGCITLG